MRRVLNLGSALLLALSAVQPYTVHAQRAEWNDARATELAARATRRRSEQLADTALRDYTARARGYVTFLAQSGEGLTEPPKVVKADELGLEVFWRAPNQSKQRILGRRDTLLLPTDIDYHRDHLGIVQNNFPDIIRLGDGDEVLDVPHPLSPRGMAEYDYRIADSLVIRLADRRIEVLQLDIRPKDDRKPRAVGAVFVERSSAQVVRMAFSFTRVALRDQSLEDVSVILENGLIEDHFWLPRRQQIEIRRSGTWLDFPFRGIIRGRWEIRDYEVNTGLPADLFTGPEIVLAPPERQQAFTFTGALLDGLPSDVRTVTDHDVRAVQEQARELVRAQALQRARSTAIQARGVSDFVRVNRVEGLALGAGLSQRLGGGVRAGVLARVSTATGAVRGSGVLALERASGAGVSVRAERALGEVGLVPEVSVTRNSLAAQEFGSDWTSPFERRQVVVRADLPPFGARRWRVALEAAREWHAQASVNATPTRGTYEAVPEITPGEFWRGSLLVRKATSLGPLGTEISLNAAVDVLRARGEVVLTRFQPLGFPIPVTDPLDLIADNVRTTARGMLDVDVQRPIGRDRLVLRTIASRAAPLTGTGLPVQAEAWLGGPSSVPGYGFHALRGRIVIAQRIEWRHPVPGPSIPLGRYGKVPAQVQLAPYVVTAFTDGRSFTLDGVPRGAYTSIGLGAIGLFDLLRLDVARGMRSNGRWMFSVDVTRDFWRIL